MRPLNKKNFGNATGKLAVRFHNGTGVVDGYIVKQLGTSKFLVSGFGGAGGVTDGGALTKVCTLGTVAAGDVCTLDVAVFGGATEKAKKFTMAKVITFAGQVLTYKLGVAATAAGQATVAALAAPVDQANDA